MWKWSSYFLNFVCVGACVTWILCFSSKRTGLYESSSSSMYIQPSVFTFHTSVSERRSYFYFPASLDLVWRGSQVCLFSLLSSALSKMNMGLSHLSSFGTNKLHPKIAFSHRFPTVWQGGITRVVCISWLSCRAYGKEHYIQRTLKITLGMFGGCLKSGMRIKWSRCWPCYWWWEYQMFLYCVKILILFNS